MFFISDINGIASPYDIEEFRLRRDLERLPEIRREEFIAAQDAGEATPGQEEDGVSLTAAASGASSEPLLRGLSSQALGLAGASALPATGGARNSVVADTAAASRRQDSEHHSTVNVVQAAQGAMRDKQFSASDTKARAALVSHRDSLTGEKYPRLTALQIMGEKLLTIHPDDSLKTAGKLFRDDEVRYLPVVSDERRLVGIISDRDYLRTQIAGNRSDPAKDAPLLVADVMVRNVLSASPNAGLRKIVEVLFHERIGAMPIVNDDGEVLGILTRSDVLRALVEHAPSEIWSS
jgi:acetoin utilization protein AcuB